MRLKMSSAGQLATALAGSKLVGYNPQEEKLSFVLWPIRRSIGIDRACEFGLPPRRRACSIVLSKCVSRGSDCATAVLDFEAGLLLPSRPDFISLRNVSNRGNQGLVSSPLTGLSEGRKELFSTTVLCPTGDIMAMSDASSIRTIVAIERFGMTEGRPRYMSHAFERMWHQWECSDCI